jgi:hypothetical protein
MLYNHTYKSTKKRNNNKKKKQRKQTRRWATPEQDHNDKEEIYWSTSMKESHNLSLYFYWICTTWKEWMELKIKEERKCKIIVLIHISGWRQFSILSTFSSPSAHYLLQLTKRFWNVTVKPSICPPPQMMTCLQTNNY